MAPKTREVPFETRVRITELRKEGLSYRAIAKKFNLTHPAVIYIVKKYEKTALIENKPRKGRPQKLTVREKRNVIRTSLKSPFTTAVDLAKQVATESGKTISSRTIQNVLMEANLYGRIARKKPYISEVNRKKRLEFAKEHVNKPL